MRFNPRAKLLAGSGELDAPARALHERLDHDEAVRRPGVGQWRISVEGGEMRVLDAGRPLLLAAQKSGELPSELTLEQILDMIVAIAKIPADAAYRDPVLSAALNALR